MLFLEIYSDSYASLSLVKLAEPIWLHSWYSGDGGCKLVSGINHYWGWVAGRHIPYILSLNHESGRFCSWIINDDHNDTIEIYWFTLSMQERQPNSTRGACPFDVACSLCSGLAAPSCGWRNFEVILQHLKKKLQRFSSLSYTLPFASSEEANVLKTQCILLICKAKRIPTTPSS